MMRKVIFHILILYSITCCQSQQNQLLVNAKLIGTCEGCEAIFEFGSQELGPIDTLPDFEDHGQKLKITGTIYQPDGVTPAEGVILYVYHTNQNGIYEAQDEDTGWARRHGYIRGWVKTGSDGKYTFYTLVPGTYPDRSESAHIHPTILEPDGKYYWLNSYRFAGDPLLTESQISPKSPRGGSSGILTLQREGHLLVGIRDFVLGKNIPDYK